MLLPVRSSSGNLFLLCAGIAFVLTSAALFAYYVLDTAGAASPTDRVLQLLLAGSGAYGLWLALAARGNLTRRRAALRGSQHELSPHPR